MNTTSSGDASGVWLASTVLGLLEERYEPGKVPSVRALARAIKEANDGASISHAQVHNILNGSATNMTDRTRTILARFLGVAPSRLVPPAQRASAHDATPSAEVLALRLSSLRPDELAAIQKAIDMLRNHSDTWQCSDRNGSTLPNTIEEQQASGDYGPGERSRS